MEGSHSPFGIIWEVAKATGWSKHYIIWKVNYQTLIMMTADAVRYVSDENKKGGTGQKRTSATEYFQTMYNEQEKDN